MANRSDFWGARASNPAPGTLGVLRRVSALAARHSSARTLPSTRDALRNARLLVSAGWQHLLDDPTMLAVQISRRLPLYLRPRVGRVVRAVGQVFPAGAGIEALGAFMAGETNQAVEILSERPGARSRLFGEVAILLDRMDLIPEGSSAPTRARAAWSRGDLSGAVRILEDAGLGSTVQCRRLRSETRLLRGGFRLPAQAQSIPRVPLDDDFDEPLRVLHLVTNSLPHTQSGYALRTHHILTGLRDHGIESVALTRTGYPVMVGKLLCADEDVIDGIRYRRTLPTALGGTPEDRLQQEVDEALCLVREFRPHVLHATTDYRNALVAQAVSVATGIPWIFEVRGLMEQTWIASHRSDGSRSVAASSEKVARIRSVERSLALEAHAVVTLSRSMADVLEGRGIPAERITLVPNGVDEALLGENLSPAHARHRLGSALRAADLAVGAVSALVDYEGHDDLLRAAALLIDDVEVPGELRDRLRVVLVGDGVSAPALAGLAKELGIEDRVLMPGRVPRAVAKLWVQALDVIVVPRKDLEVSRTVTPQKPAEALALGRPVVVSSLPALRETITGAEGELLGAAVSPDSPEELARALLDLLRDEERRGELATRGRAAAMDRTWPAMMERYEVAYRAVLMTASEETTSGE